MAYLAIQTFSQDEEWSSQVELDGTVYTIRGAWTQRENASTGDWWIGIYDADDVVALRDSIRVVEDFPLAIGVLPGYFWFSAPKGLLGTQADLDRATLFYVEAGTPIPEP